ncbi:MULTISPECIES: hypothetical protein [Streptomyces]|uniref:Uncharacterized protein n=1 Tax=Streptomyces koelreuteriae TaxID=2838015 RepID=A0ABX8G458_9ACTN|nr:MULTISPECIES: hypothetical protein [Streptomyces]QWB28029.1 hypothetical protein KJK29_38540 [Streptomyces koelreuteriae]UUA18747.1 hypothetical protein NNW99_38645 [Streptomyces sp. CRCS-T-1]
MRIVLTGPTGHADSAGHRPRAEGTHTLGAGARRLPDAFDAATCQTPQVPEAARRFR